MTPEQKNTLYLKRLKLSRVGNCHGGGDTGNGKGNSKGPTLKSLNRSIVALATNLTILTCLIMMMMMMNPQRKRKYLPTSPMQP
jgi:hypothetical protein